ncbi:nitroreductase [Sphaerisporangium melleum]|uniref:Nitroreductase n=1 Tax=Sphaerisporangium melleum TaxID=321316 RepID=A0A917R7J4_9ACTN|nr:nitroreductase family protein [Sphaerisporangium melleum]GGK93999.1 nitroreductase [Sphaerisporangium melleum]GII73357.1 nitroreductase [Sphaerisporangium melleum]
MAFPADTELGVRWLLTAAGQAPSVHNTQPWRFRITGRSIELLADPDRRLRRIDPRGRSMRVSCGAALFNLRIAVRVAGFRPLTRLLPDPSGEQRLLAAVHMSDFGPATPAEQVLYANIDKRRTNREPFEDRRVPPWVLADLRIAASREGANLVLLGERRSADLLDYVVMAEEKLAEDHDYQAELRAWTMSGAHSDGLPSYVMGPRAIGDAALARDFGAQSHRPAERFERRPQIAVLTTPEDRPADWLRAGQALQRVLLLASAHGVSASFLNQPLDLRDMRHRLDPRHRRGHPQMIIRLGYGPPVPRAPRRPSAELRTGAV